MGDQIYGGNNGSHGHSFFVNVHLWRVRASGGELVAELVVDESVLVDGFQEAGYLLLNLQREVTDKDTILVFIQDCSHLACVVFMMTVTLPL